MRGIPGNDASMDYTQAEAGLNALIDKVHQHMPGREPSWVWWRGHMLTKDGKVFRCATVDDEKEEVTSEDAVRVRDGFVRWLKGTEQISARPLGYGTLQWTRMQDPDVW